MISSTEPPSRQAILDLLTAQDAPTSPEQLAVQLKVGPDAVIPLRRRLAAMQRDGQILQNRKGGLMPVSRIDLVAGKVAGHRDGFGFLLPDDASGDIFLPPREMQKVMHGDRVLVRRTGTDSRGRTEGSIVEVTARANRTLVGRLVNERGVLLVVPEDQRIKHDVMIQPGGTMGATPGQVVSAEITEPPAQHTPPIGRVVEILGEVDDPGMEIEIAVRKFDVPHQFSEELLREVAALPDTLRPADYRNRVDLRDVPMVTIDGEDARDFDDAVYCEPLDPAKPSAGWRLLVAIADVSHYVRPGELLDQEAQARSTSVYFPRRVIPMLPEKLSNGLCSLNPGVDRLVLVADMVVDAKGGLKAYQFYPAVIHSAARLTYNEVWGIISGRDPVAIQKRAPLVGHLNDLHALFRILLKARNLARCGRLRHGRDQDHLRSRRAHPVDRRTGTKRRPPADRGMHAERQHLRGGFPGATEAPGPLPGPRGADAGASGQAARIPRRDWGCRSGSRTPTRRRRTTRRCPRSIAGRPDASLLQTMMLRSMQQAIYTPFNSGHFGLAYEAYAHYTSPIRRYPDLLNHRAIKALLAGTRYRPQLLALTSDPAIPDAAEIDAGAVAAWRHRAGGRRRAVDPAARPLGPGRRRPLPSRPRVAPAPISPAGRRSGSSVRSTSGGPTTPPAMSRPGSSAST